MIREGERGRGREREGERERRGRVTYFPLYIHNGALITLSALMAVALTK